MLKTLQNKLSRYDIFAIILCSTALIIWLKIVVYKFYYFGYYDWDLAIFTQGMWSLSQGTTNVSLFVNNFFANHSNLIAYLLIPLFKIFSHALTLVILKILTYIGCAWGIYWIAKEKIGERLAILIMLAYLLYPANHFALLYEFDFEALAPGLILLTYYFFQKEKPIPFFIFSVLSMSVKENMPLIILAFGILGLITKRNKLIWGIFPIVLGITTFYFLTSIFIPMFKGGGEHNYTYLYESYGKTPVQIIFHLISHPQEILSSFLKPEIIELSVELLTPLLFLPLLGLQALFLSSPLFIQYFLSTAPQQHSLGYNYYFLPTLFLFFATIEGLSFLNKKLDKKITIIFASGMILLLTSLNFLSHQDKLQARLNYRNDFLLNSRWEMVNLIPKDEGVIASFYFLSSLSTRKDLYAFYKVFNPVYPDFKCPQPVRYALIDFGDIWLKSLQERDQKKIASRIRPFMEENDWYLKYAANKIVLLSKEKTDYGKLIEHLPSKVENDPHPALLNYKDTFELSKIEVDTPPALPNSKNKTFIHKFYWNSLKEINESYSLLFFVKAAGKMIYYHQRDIGYGIYPTTTWKEGDQFMEQYWLTFPELPTGDYTIEFAIITKDELENTPDITKLPTFKTTDFSIK